MVGAFFGLGPALAQTREREGHTSMVVSLSLEIPDTPHARSGLAGLGLKGLSKLSEEAMNPNPSKQ